MTNAVTIAQGGSAGTVQGFKNRIINGTMSVWQRGTSFPSLNTNTYACDRFSLNTGNSTGGRVTLTQSTDVPAGTGLPYSLRLQPTITESGMTVNEFWSFIQMVEANNCADLAYGTPSAKSITLSYWVKCSLAGTYCGTIIQSQASTARCFPWVISVPTPNTWQQVVVVIPGDTAGNIPANNGPGFEIDFIYAGIGSSYQSGTANTWNTNSAGTQYIASGQTYVNVLSNTNNTIQIAGVQLEVGSAPTSQEFRPYGIELLMCQRYYQVLAGYSYPALGSGGSVNSSISVIYIKLITTMRTTPTVSYTGNLIITDRTAYDAAVSSLGSYAPGTDSVSLYFNHASSATAGKFAILAVANVSNGALQFSAEI